MLGPWHRNKSSYLNPQSWKILSIHPQWQQVSKAKVMETKADAADSFWTWNANNDQKQFSVTKFLGNNKPPKPQTSVLGPGFGAGIGCGAGIGLGLVGGFGYGGWPFNHMHFVFGLGIGCGVGVGFGFGQGIGYDFNFRTRKSRKSKKNFSDPQKTIVIQIWSIHNVSCCIFHFAFRFVCLVSALGFWFVKIDLFYCLTAHHIYNIR